MVLLLLPIQVKFARGNDKMHVSPILPSVVATTVIVVIRRNKVILGKGIIGNCLEETDEILKYFGFFFQKNLKLAGVDFDVGILVLVPNVYFCQDIKTGRPVLTNGIQKLIAVDRRWIIQILVADPSNIIGL